MKKENLKLLIEHDVDAGVIIKNMDNGEITENIHFLIETLRKNNAEQYVELLLEKGINVNIIVPELNANEIIGDIDTLIEYDVDIDLIANILNSEA